ncbi:hypothetical protein AB1Y20_008149 [Prymnesium parvum]|uniref:Uncharacterized protein n=1 Tax=Prymnesium parvum TaxID=97485 RepID=A0AB34IW93_PRYPA
MAPAASLPSCTDRPATTLPFDCRALGRATSGFGAAGSNRYSHGQVLCPALASLQNASCATLTSARQLLPLLQRVAAEPLCCKLGWAGLAHSARELAALLASLAAALPPPPAAGAVRFLSLHSANGWLALLAGDVRKLMQMAGLSYRRSAAFEPLAELALLSHDPRPNRAILPHADTPARRLLPRGWNGTAAPFAACLRVGAPLDLEGFSRDLKDLAPVCRAVVFWSGPPGGGERVQSDEEAEAAGARLRVAGTAFHLDAFARSGAQQPRAHHAGNWTILTASLPALLHFENHYDGP